VTALELFGAGGAALGLHRAGFAHVACIERNASAAATLRAGQPLGAGDGASPSPPHLRYHAEASAVEGRRLPGARRGENKVATRSPQPPNTPFGVAGDEKGRRPTDFIIASQDTHARRRSAFSQAESQSTRRFA
jgi:site-specific DNA-cytosine methylase